MIALYIILAVIALIVILFSIKVSVTAVYDETFTLDVKWLFIKFRIYPEDEEKKAKKEAKKAEKEQKKRTLKRRNTKRKKLKNPHRLRAIFSRISITTRVLRQLSI